jgi:hypothetical protein
MPRLLNAHDSLWTEIHVTGPTVPRFAAINCSGKPGAILECILLGEVDFDVGLCERGNELWVSPKK